MSEKQKILAFEKKLEQLKKEETEILKILKDVRKQLRKYEVEELQTCNSSIANRNDEDSESDQSSEGDNEMLLRFMDAAGVVNKISLDLDASRVFGEAYKESEESEESD